MLIGIFIALVLGMGTVSAVDWWLARVLPQWLFALLTMLSFAVTNIWRGYRKAAKGKASR